MKNQELSRRPLVSMAVAATSCATLLAAYEILLVHRLWALESGHVFFVVLSYYILTVPPVCLCALLARRLAIWSQSVHANHLALSVLIFCYVYFFLGMLVNIHILPHMTSPISVMGNVLYLSLSLLFARALYQALKSRFPWKWDLVLSTAIIMAVVFYMPPSALSPGTRDKIPTARDSRTQAPNVILILIDALRADHVSALGYHKLTTPNIDEYARKGASFERAYSQSDWTLPSVASVFTSLLPESHGVIKITDGLPYDKPILTETLKRHGYRTGIFSANHIVSRERGYARGADTIYRPENVPLRDRLGITNILNRLGLFQLVSHLPGLPEKQEVGNWQIEDDRLVLDRAHDFITASDDFPCFAYVHLISPHAPYEPPERDRKLFCPGCNEADYALSRKDFFRNSFTLEETEAMVNLYDAEIHYSDRIVGRFLERVLNSSRGRETVVIITSDHGESFNDHGPFSHGNNLYEEEIRVPWIIYYPQKIQPGTTIDIPVGTIDIYPTLLELSGVPGEERLQGVSLVRLMRGDPDDTETREPIIAQKDRSLYSLIDEKYKLIGLISSKPQFELFDLKSDRLEKQDIYENQDFAQKMRTKLELAIERAGKGKGKNIAVEMTDKQRDNLRALGYVQ